MECLIKFQILRKALYVESSNSMLFIIDILRMVLFYSFSSFVVVHSISRQFIRCFGLCHDVRTWFQFCCGCCCFAFSSSNRTNLSVKNFIMIFRLYLYPEGRFCVIGKWNAKTMQNEKKKREEKKKKQSYVMWTPHAFILMTYVDGMAKSILFCSFFFERYLPIQIECPGMSLEIQWHEFLNTF